MKKMGILILVVMITSLLIAACGQKQTLTAAESSSSTEQVGESVAAIDTLNNDLATEPTDETAEELGDLTW